MDSSKNKKFTLHNLKTNKFKVWEVTIKATLKHYERLGIIEGTDSDLIPHNPNGIAYIIPLTLCVRVNRSENDHECTRDVIIHCLPKFKLLQTHGCPQ